LSSAPIRDAYTAIASSMAIQSAHNGIRHCG
jgi:hypothetical protein